MKAAVGGSALAFLFMLAMAAAGNVSAGEDVNRGWRLVNFWSEWCSPCRKEIPMLNELRRELSAAQVRVVGVNFDDQPRSETLETAGRMGIEFYTLTAAQLEALELRAPDVMPTTYIVSPAGESVARLIGLQSREQILGQLLRLGVVLPGSE